MPLSADRVKETTTSTGTGSITLAGAATGFRAFSAAFTNGDQIYYCITDGTAWEVGYGTLSAGTTLSRDTVLASSNAGALVNFSAGTKDVFATMPYSRLVGDVYFGTAAPTDASCSLWWNTDDGNLYIRYNDGDSTQWVSAAAGIQGPKGDTGITVSSTAPATPDTNDLWLQI